MTTFRTFQDFLNFWSCKKLNLQYNVLVFFCRSKVLYLLSQVKITLSIYLFMFKNYIFLVLQFFFTVLGIFKYFNIAKMPYLENLSHILNKNIFNKRNFWFKNKIKIRPIDELLEVLGFTTFSIYLVFQFEWHSYLSDTLIWVKSQFVWHSNLSDIPIWVIF